MAAAAGAARALHAGREQHWQEAEELMWRRAAVAAGAAKIPLAGGDRHWGGPEEPVERPAVAAAGNAMGACISGGWCQDTKLEGALARSEEDPDQCRSMGPSPRDVLA